MQLSCAKTFFLCLVQTKRFRMSVNKNTGTQFRCYIDKAFWLSNKKITTFDKSHLLAPRIDYSFTMN